MTFEEFPQMDNRWVCFGEILSGMELLEKIEDWWPIRHPFVILGRGQSSHGHRGQPLEDEYEGRAKMVSIADCGDLSLEDED